MKTVWILWYLNTYMIGFGIFESEQDALHFVSEFEHPEWFKAVELPIQASGTTWENRIEPFSSLPPQGQR